MLSPTAASNIHRRVSHNFSPQSFISPSFSQPSSICAAIARLPDAMGKPHVHAGLGIRKLRKAMFEVRAGLQTRVLFARESGDLVLVFAGSHSQVRTWLKENV